jgi:RNA polymerase sigma-B factor
VRVPRGSQELALAVIDANNSLTATLGGAPTVTDVAAHLDVNEDDVLQGIDAVRLYTASSLSTPIADQLNAA